MFFLYITAVKFVALTSNCAALNGVQTDPLTESRIEKPHPVYVPRDETFEEIKQNTFSTGRLKALLHNLLPSLAVKLSSSDIPFKCFSDIDKLYNDGLLLKDDDEQTESVLFSGNMLKQVLTVGEKWLKYEIPAIIKSNLHLFSFCSALFCYLILCAREKSSGFQCQISFSCFSVIRG